jgi:hypothetical protein
VGVSEFEAWWSDYLTRTAGVRDAGAVIDDLRARLARLPAAERALLEDGFVEVVLGRREGWSEAAGALEGRLTRAGCSRIAARAVSLQRASLEDESYEAQLMRLLAASPACEEAPVVRSYLLDEPIGMYWSTVPWSLWPRDTDLFIAAQMRYLAERGPESVRGTAVIQSFFNTPTALALLKEALVRSDRQALWERFRRAALDTRDTYLDDEKRHEVEAILCASAS